MHTRYADMVVDGQHKKPIAVAAATTIETGKSADLESVRFPPLKRPVKRGDKSWNVIENYGQHGVQSTAPSHTKLALFPPPLCQRQGPPPGRGRAPRPRGLVLAAHVCRLRGQQHPHPLLHCRDERGRLRHRQLRRQRSHQLIRR